MMIGMSSKHLANQSPAGFLSGVFPGIGWAGVTGATGAITGPQHGVGAAQVCFFLHNPPLNNLGFGQHVGAGQQAAATGAGATTTGAGAGIIGAGATTTPVQPA
jgi:hypothetical protein